QKTAYEIETCLEFRRVLFRSALVSIAVRLSPLWSFLYWGSDTGEYFSILRALVRGDHLSTTYYGWGVTYPYFPGMFFAQAGVVEDRKSTRLNSSHVSISYAVF